MLRTISAFAYRHRETKNNNGGAFEPLEKAREFLTTKTVKTGPEAHPVPSTMDTKVPSRGKSGRGVALIIHHHLQSKLR
jgi:hypothetical protein